jgi:hypothetical protein
MVKILFSLTFSQKVLLLVLLNYIFFTLIFFYSAAPNHVNFVEREKCGLALYLTLVLFFIDG